MHLFLICGKNAKLLIATPSTAFVIIDFFHFCHQNVFMKSIYETSLKRTSLGSAN